MDGTKFMLTTVDNPFNPYTQFEDWDAFDQNSGYFSMSLLARICVVSDELPDADYYGAIENAIEEIVDVNASGMHTKAYPPDENG